MAIEATQEKELSSAIRSVVEEFEGLLLPLDEAKINTVPYEGSWTPAQLFRHVTKSIDGLSQALQARGVPAERDAGERIGELKKTFLDFSLKIKSPEFIVPEPGPYHKQTIADDLRSAENKMIENAEQADMREVVSGLPFGPITKWEIYYFTLFHTQRHIHQMKKMADAFSRM